MWSGVLEYGPSLKLGVVAVFGTKGTSVDNITTRENISLLSQCGLVFSPTFLVDNVLL